MPIFNSLGSDYNLSFVLNTLFTSNNSFSKTVLVDFLRKKYSGDVLLFYKGREAITAALNVIGKKGTTVVMNGLTCFAVYEAIKLSGYDIAYVDVAENTLHFTKKQLEKCLEKNSTVSAVIIQNTLGYPCDIEEIGQICKKKNIILIEDLAHSIGTMYTNGKEAGTIGDFVALSFSQDKMIDGISGGALIIRNKELGRKNTRPTEQKETISLKKQYIDKVYPLLTTLIRKTYSVGLGKGIHTLLKMFHLLSRPVESPKGLHELPNWYCKIILNVFEQLETNRNHRKEIANFYANTLHKNMLSQTLIQDIQRSSNLRFPIFVQNRESLITHLAKYSIYVSDIWYDSPVAPKRYLRETTYTNQCPEAEKVAATILNLPTHCHVLMKDAQRIVEYVNLWQQSQQNK